MKRSKKVKAIVELVWWKSEYLVYRVRTYGPNGLYSSLETASKRFTPSKRFRAEIAKATIIIPSTVKKKGSRR